MTPLRARFLGMGGLVLVCLGLLGLAAWHLVALERQMRISATENMIWIFGQTQAEALHLALALSDGADPAAVGTRFDLLLSRLGLLDQGPQRRFLQAAGVFDVLSGWSATLLDNDPAAGGDLGALADDVTRLIAALRGSASLAMSHEWQEQAAHLDRLGHLHRLALMAVLVAGLAGLGLALILIDRERRLMRARLDRIEAARLAQALDRERELSENHRQFADLIAHQLRTPLAVIDSAMHRLTRHGATASAALIAEKAAVSREAVARLVSLSDTALMMSRLERDAIQPRLRAHDLHELAQKCVETLARSRPADAARITVIAAETPVTAACDLSLTSEILSNLIGNALSYAPPKSPVTVAVGAENGQMWCRISDRGPGMNAADLARAFDQFRRGAGQGSVPGSGLGLTLARHLARLQGGEVTLAPRASGGLTATLTLPRPAP